MKVEFSFLLQNAHDDFFLSMKMKTLENSEICAILKSRINDEDCDNGLVLTYE